MPEPADKPMPQKEIDIVRDLARKVAEIAALPVQQQKVEMWTRHNDLQRVRPMVLVFPEGSWRELMAGWEWACEDPFCRGLEQRFRTTLYSWAHLRDDNVVEPIVRCGVAVHNTGCGLGVEATRPDDPTGACHYEPVLREESDIEKIKMPEISVDWDATNKGADKMREVLDDILSVEIGAWGSHGWAPMDQFIQWRGIDNLYTDLMDRPQWVHAVMSRLLNGKLAEIDALETQGALRLNNRNHYCGSGGVGYTSQLPQPDYDPAHIRPKDVWGFATAQIFSEVSPAMHDEFALRYEKQFLARFGLAAYGCCEPLDRKLDIVKAIPNLRRISISPWADVETCAAGLGKQYVFNWKPNPAVVAADHWDPEGVRAHLRDFCEKTRDCLPEMVMKDTHTCRHEPHRMWDWTRIAMEVAEEFA